MTDPKIINSFGHTKLFFKCKHSFTLLLWSLIQSILLYEVECTIGSYHKALFQLSFCVIWVFSFNATLGGGLGSHNLPDLEESLEVVDLT